MRSAIAVANHIITSAEKDKAALSGSQLQYLSYFAHGLRLAMVNEPLLDEPVLADRDGVVISSLSAAGASNTRIVKDLMTTVEKLPSGMLTVLTPMLEQADPALPTLDLVWSRFGGVATYDLSTFVRSAESPWDEIWNDPERLAGKLSASITQVWRDQADGADRGIVIPNSVIRRWFRQMVIQEQKVRDGVEGLEHTVHVAHQRLEETIRVAKDKNLRAG